MTEPLLSSVIEAVARHYGADPASIVSPRRVTSHVVARHTAMYVARLAGHYSYTEIAEAFNRKDHTTIRSACLKMEKLASKDKGYSRVIDRLVLEVQGGIFAGGGQVRVRPRLFGLLERRVHQGIYGKTVEDEVDRILCEHFQRAGRESAK